MAYVRRPRVAELCARCGEGIPSTRRADARYCSLACSSTDGVSRHKAKDPIRYHREKVLSQRKRRHLKEYGHLDFIDNPDLNPNDKYAPARSFGMRSMLEVNIARHLDAAGGQMVTKSNWVRSKNHLVKIKAKLRSGLEDRVVEQLEEASFEYEYETLKLAYTTAHTYTPDLILENGMIVECKGLFTSEDRSKHLAVKKAHPHLDIRFVFSRSKSPLYKGSKSTYASWCEQKGFKYADKLIPQAWLDEVKGEIHDTDAANSQTPSQSRVDLAARSNPRP